MATIYIGIPAVPPDQIVVKQAATEGGVQTEVVNANYATFLTVGDRLAIESALLLPDKYSFVYFVVGTESTFHVTVPPAGSLAVPVQTIFNSVLPRLRIEPPVRDFMATVNHVLDYIDRRLTELDSDLIKGDVAHVLAEGDWQVNLPFGMLGMDEDPWIIGANINKITLSRLPEWRRGTFTGLGTPKFYEVRKGSLNVYPASDSTLTLHYTTYDRTRVSKLTDAVPYGGLFNDLIVELVVKFGSNPVAATVDPILEMMVNKSVDRIIRKRSNKSIRWAHLSNYR
jgi:hypothetical protein